MPPFLRLSIALCAVVSATPVATLAQPSPVLVVFDTDMGPDSDDTGALAMLHALADLGEAEILGTLCSTTSPWCAPAIDVINTYYGRPEVPVGTLKGPGSAGGGPDWYGESFNAFLAGHYPNALRHGEYAPDAVTLYRHILAAALDESVAIVVVGPLTNIRDLLVSPPDAISPLDGRQLALQKVKLLSVMGGRYPSGSESNFTSDAGASQTVVAEWPTRIMFSGFELGVEVFTGPRLWTETPEDSPVRMAYHLWELIFARRFAPDFDPQSGIWPHSSYDQTSVLYAVRGLRDYWDSVTEGANVVHEDGSNEWHPDLDRPHAYLVERMPREEVARIIEDLMVAPPGSRPPAAR
jgi:hypothetical protein